ncbi:MAG: hypothetical protein ACK5UX_15935 [Burkholderiales bacterium]|jgi:hypothetical protein|nr:hypothetical protein [Nitrosomonadaceae bacterium]
MSSLKEINMTYRVVWFAALLGALIALTVSAQPRIPGWMLAGSDPQSYSIGISEKAGRLGGPAGYLQGRGDTDGFGTMMQTFLASQYEGNRVRISAQIKTENLKQAAGLWMRVDGKRGKVLSFDNMMDRPIKGSTDWKRYEIVLDAPSGTERIAFGVLMVDRGHLWVEDVKFEVVSATVPVTTKTVPPEDPDARAPQNLDFKMR